MIWRRETIGPAECPLFHRWTLLAPKLKPKGNAIFKVLLHHFVPDRLDFDFPHDHPRSFVTFVFRGGYTDLTPCTTCNGQLSIKMPGGWWEWCPNCRDEKGSTGRMASDELNAPCFRYRPAAHAHMTQTDARGAWTIVIMGPETRAWGFWRLGEWTGWREFLDRYGSEERCD